MVFSSIPFLYYFLPCTMLLYFLVPRKAKNALLLLSSLVFYGWGEPKLVVLMLLTIAQGYFFGLLIEKFGGKRAKLFLVLSVAVCLGLLGYFKYADFFLDNFRALTGLPVPLLNLALPVGISFYTFQILSYTVDVYRKDVPAQRNFIDLAAYITMFPQLIAGPIVRYSDIAAQLKSRTHTVSGAALGLRRFLLGLAKKVLVADILGELCSRFRDSGEKSVLFFWLYAVAYTLHIYFDFSGYSDMAIGLGKIMGFDFLENFRYPYISRSITEFWRRWHISLGSWFRDYVYIPLGGNRVKKARWLLNLLIVWLLTGFWHGAAWNFVLWGLFYGVLLMLEKLFLGKWLDKSRVLRHIYVLLAVILGFVLFDAADVGTAFYNIRSMFGGSGLPLLSAEGLYCLKSYAPILLLAALGATPLPARIVAALKARPTAARVLNLAEPLLLLLLLCAVTAYIVDGSFSPFLYFRF